MIDSCGTVHCHGVLKLDQVYFICNRYTYFFITSRQSRIYVGVFTLVYLRWCIYVGVYMFVSLRSCIYVRVFTLVYLRSCIYVRVEP